eukprot:12145460-Karenia_brevis.AAC.1
MINLHLLLNKWEILEAPHRILATMSLGSLLQIAPQLWLQVSPLQMMISLGMSQKGHWNVEDLKDADPLLPGGHLWQAKMKRYQFHRKPLKSCLRSSAHAN